jgi:hypothetical protein
VHESANGSKSLFALVIKNSPGCRRDFRVKMWGTSSPDDKLTGNLGNVIEAALTAVVGRIVFWRENYHRAILDFCNNIGTKRPCRDRLLFVRFRGEADVRKRVASPALVAELALLSRVRAGDVMLPFSVVNAKDRSLVHSHGFPRSRMPVASSAQAPATIFSAAVLDLQRYAVAGIPRQTSAIKGA